ncbi:flagellar filament capping protein FliD [Treponema sp.]|uniref:flagellar filament capping protein FliD n=1 Tax=Treponema sp. TaxID=166 RepID=UPI003EFEB0D7
MADGLNIPGVSDKYKTNDLVESLMEVERIPLKREEANLETYKKHQDAWRGINQKMSSLQDSVKTLYSFENPFSNRISSSSEEYAVTADAGREADFGSFKIEIINPASADRFLSDEIDANMQVDAGTYTYSAGEKKVEFSWKGGKLSDFVSALNKRGNSVVKASLIGVSAGKKALLIESLKTGAENRLVFENSALDFAKKIGMISPVKAETTVMKYSAFSAETPETKDKIPQEKLPPISKSKVSESKGIIKIEPRGGFEQKIPSEIASSSAGKIQFSFSGKKTGDITESAADSPKETLELPIPLSVTYEGISIFNNPSDSTLPPAQEQQAFLSPVEIPDDQIFFIKDSSGKEHPLGTGSFSKDSDGKTKVSVSLSDFPGAQSLVVRNSNTGKTIEMTAPVCFDETKSLGFEPRNAISTAQDAKLKYEGITITRPTNDIDDIVPHVTIHVHEKTERPANIKIEPDTESAKDAIITFVGKYNQAIAEMNILSINKPEIVSELDYLSSDEQDKAYERLGMFQGDFSLTNGKSSLQQTVASSYRFSDNAAVTMLSQIGVSTNAGGGARGYSPSQMRGYLEVDEKKLDENLKAHLDEIKNLFGYDSDGDLIIDDGIGYKIDRQLTSWVQSGGIISAKTNSLETQIKNSNSKITRLQTQLDRKEAELKRKYANMEGTLNSLESQQSSMQNFSNQNSRNR